MQSHKISYPSHYEFALTKEEIDLKWPKLIQDQNFVFSSRKGTGFNCVGFAMGEDFTDIDMMVFSKKYDLSTCGLSNDPLDHSASGYMKLFKGFYGFEKSVDGVLEAGFEKIALYEGYDDNRQFGFLHVALQLPDGNWKSKMGNYEDIAHDSPSAIEGNFYGKVAGYMKRSISFKPKWF